MTNLSCQTVNPANGTTANPAIHTSSQTTMAESTSSIREITTKEKHGTSPQKEVFWKNGIPTFDK
ncbi:MAG: hypothetical protein LUH15_20645 [Tannerellaceae bacterium]|nr:hypothetical protein [Tannerellaceae bacterium]